MPRALLTAFLLLAACTPASPVNPTVGRSASTPAPAAPLARPEVVRIELYEWSVNIDPPDLPAGRYRVEVVNYGERVHSVMVAGPSVDRESRRLRAGGVQQLEIEFQPGEYTLWCPIGDHRDYGMVTYLTVELAPPA